VVLDFIKMKKGNILFKKLNMTETYLTLYTDGSCTPNPGKGGWGCIAVFEDEDVYISGKAECSTNNIMELTAVIEGLKYYKDNKYFKIYTDSLYVLNCATGKWKRTKNLELWKRYDKYSKNKSIIWNWVKGHNGDKYNELVDKLAKS